MIFEQIVYGVGELLVKIPAMFYLILFLIFFVIIVVISVAYKFHLKKYAFRNYTSGIIRLVYISGLGILTLISIILLVIIFAQL
ncbi:MAG: hypothetical protein ACI870_000233 [Crocinitomicaceae bacterium]|jgi:hypothetical protein